MKLLILILVFLVCAVNSFAAVKTWDGGGVDDNLRTAANWVDDIAPASGDDLVFPAVAARYTPINNMPFGATIRSMTFEGGTYTMSAANILFPQAISAGVVVLDGTQTLNFLLSLSAPQTFATNGPAAVLVSGGVSLGTRTLTIDGVGGVGLGLVSGSGQIIKNGSGGGLIVSAQGYSGAVSINQGLLIIDGSMPTSAVTVNAVPAPLTFDFGRFGLSEVSTDQGQGVTVAGGFGGTGTVGTVNLINGGISAGTLNSPNGILNTGNLTIGPDGVYLAKLNGVTAGANGYDQINVTGTVTINNAQLQILPSEATPPSMKRPLVILRNDGTDPISGTFLNLPEGALITSTSGTTRFRISYLGGDGNDIILTRVRLPRP